LRGSIGAPLFLLSSLHYGLPAGEFGLVFVPLLYQSREIMKKALLFVFSIMFLGLSAQVTVTLQPIPSEGWANLDDDDTNPKNVNAHATITNTSDASKTFRWILTVDSQEEPWGFAVCDINTCYNAGVTTETFTLLAGQSSIMDVHVYPSGDQTTLEGAVPGTGSASLKITEMQDPDNTVTGTYNFNIEGEAVPTSLTELELSQLKLFPNPTADYFEVQGPEGVATVSIYNLFGTAIENFAFQSGEKYNVSNYAKGLYLVALEDEDGQLLKTMRLQKY